VIGLPSFQAKDRSQGARIWIASEATDVRCGFDRLAERVNAVVGENSQSESDGLKAQEVVSGLNY
jgi:transposase